MSEIEKGEYVRTKKGEIYTVKSITKFPDGDIHIYVNEEIIFFRPIEIVKHSKNIIELVEEGDYVDGMLVIEADLENEVDNQICIWTLNGEIYLLNDDIKSIVTKEQFKNMEYEVGE